MSGEPSRPKTGATARQPLPATFLRALLVATGVGIPVSLAAFGFMALSHALGEFLWQTLPDQAGFSGDAWWWVLLLPTVGGALSGLAVHRLPGGGGHEPIKGFTAEPVLPRAIPGVVLAALASLSFGAVLGPEAPLLALGSALGLWFARIAKLSGEVAPLGAAAGLFASISALLGNPLPGAFLVLEAVGMAGAGAPLVAVVLPGMLAAAAGYLLITGVGSWSGIGISGFDVLSLPEYPTLRIQDLLWAVVLGVVMAVVVFAVRAIAQRLHDVGSRKPSLVAPGAGLVVGAAAVAYGALTEQPPHLVLFSGETGAGTVVADGATWGAAALALLLLFKAIAYVASLGSFFRGGPVFPALFLGVTSGVLLSELVPGASLTAGVVAGMAAATAATLRLPLSAVLLAVFLGGVSAVDATSLALIASVVAFVTVQVLGRGRQPRLPGAIPRSTGTGNAEEARS